MQLAGYFEFLGPCDIRVKGTRIGIETILGDYLERGRSAAEIAARYRSLNIEQVQATLEYYRQNRAQVDAYRQAVRAELARQRAEQEANPPPGLVRLRSLMAAGAAPLRES